MIDRDRVYDMTTVLINSPRILYDSNKLCRVLLKRPARINRPNVRNVHTLLCLRSAQTAGAKSPKLDVIPDLVSYRCPRAKSFQYSNSTVRHRDSQMCITTHELYSEDDL